MTRLLLHVKKIGPNQAKDSELGFTFADLIIIRSKVTRLENRVMNILKAYSWPGNVRESKNVLTKAILASRSSVLLADAVQAVLTAS